MFGGSGVNERPAFANTADKPKLSQILKPLVYRRDSDVIVIENPMNVRRSLWPFGFENIEGIEKS